MNGDARLERLRRGSLLAGALGLLVLLLGALFDRERFFRSYLIGYLPWLSLSLGALAVLMLHHLAAGEWGFVVRRFLEAASRNLALLALLFLPIALGMGSIYPWVDPGEAVDPLLAHKDAYLNVPFFLGRAVLYFAVWIFLAARLSRLSRRQDEGGSAEIVHRLQRLSGPGLILYSLTVTFAFIDWAMSLEFHWYSSIYGMQALAGQGLSALVFAVLALQAFSQKSPFREIVKPGHFHALGNLVLAFVMLWAYMAFSQYLIIWSGNLPEDIRFYLHRSGGWHGILLALIVLHFAAPFLLLLSRAAKAKGRALAGIAGLLFAMRFVDHFWLVAPAFHPGELTLHWMDLAAPIGIGGIWLWAFLGELRKAPLLSAGDRRFEGLLPSREELAHGAG